MTLNITLTTVEQVGEIAKRAAGAYYTPSLFGPRTRWMVRLLSKFG